MQHLYHHAYDLCTRASCAKALWGRDYDPLLDDQALDRMVSNLRQQLHKLVPETEFIVTRRGVGYILILNP
jgi:DNA-binding response OmpR family regulator